MGKVDLRTSHGSVAGYLAVPTKGKGPGVLVLHAWWGLNDFFMGLCDGLAAEGFVAFAPDLYHGASASTTDEAEKLESKLKEDTARKDLTLSAEGLRSHPNVRGNRIGILGRSLGAFWGLWLTMERPSDVAAVVVFYGAMEGNYSKTRAAFLGHFAEEDEYQPDHGIREFEGRLRAARKEITIHRYPGTTHWFFEADRPDAYDANAAELAWRRTTEFLATHLGGPKS